MSDVFIISRNGKLSSSNGTFLFSDYEGNCQTIFPHLTDQITSVGSLNITASALNLLISNKISVFFMSRSGLARGTLNFSLGKNVFIRQKQYELLGNLKKKTEIAKAIVRGKIQNQRRFLQRHENNENALSELKSIVNRLEVTDTLCEIRGMEGAAAHVYFSTLAKNLPLWTKFKGRESHPPRDPFNSLLSFLYTLLSYRIEGYIIQEGFDPAVGVLHELSYGRNSLVCDLMEEYRVALADSIAGALVNRNQIREGDFYLKSGDIDDEEKQYPVCLSEKAIKTIIEAFENKLQAEVYYPSLGYAIPYWKIMKKQIKQFRKVLECEEERYNPMFFR